MKKAFSLLLAAALCLTLASCSNRAEEEVSQEMPTVSQTTTTDPVTSTTAPAKKNTEKGNTLKKNVLGALGNKKTAKLTGSLAYGSFEYQYSREPEVIYANERSDEFEQRASANAQGLVDKIKSCYNDEIKLDRTYFAQIGDGDNGLDSVRYEFYYINTQNQQLKIFADSDGEISYARCDFTW